MSNTSLFRPCFGDIVFANLPMDGSVQGGLRPVLIVQNNKGNQYSSTVEVLPLTTRLHKGMHLPTHVLIEPDETNCLNRPSIVLGENVLTIPMARLAKKIGQLNENKLIQVGKARHIQSPLPFEFV